jgi:hypothetical protein
MDITAKTIDEDGFAQIIDQLVKLRNSEEPAPIICHRVSHLVHRLVPAAELGVLLPQNPAIAVAGVVGIFPFKKQTEPVHLRSSDRLSTVQEN